MKNVFIIQSEAINKVGDICLFPYGINIAGKADIGYPTQNIYITSDEEIKEDYVIVYGVVIKVMMFDNDFLQWFVNNSNCEFVETLLEKEYGEYETGGGLSTFRGYEMKYKIIIPKKNFYCGDEVDYGEKCDFQCEGCNNATGVDYGFLPQEKTLDNIMAEKMLEKADVTVTMHKGTALTTEEVMKGRSSAYEFIDFDKTKKVSKNYYEMESVANYRGNYDFKCPNCKDTIDDLMFSKEPIYCFKCTKILQEKNKTDLDYNTGYYDGMKVGVQWQQEQTEKIYTKEDMLEAFNVGNRRGHSGYPNTDNWTQPTFEDFISRKKEDKTEIL